MVGIIVSGHGKFASGVQSVINLLAGEQKNIQYIDFLEGDSTKDLKKKLDTAVNSLNCEGLLFFTDIPGGTPFKACVEISLERENCEVLSGTNIPMLMEILFNRCDIGVEDLRDKAIDIGKKQIFAFTAKKRKTQETGDGI